MRKAAGLLAVSFFSGLAAFAQVPGMINYQGRVAVGGTNFSGTALFRFALNDGAGAATFWSNGVGAVSIPVNKGLYSVLLGDTSVVNMAVVPAGVFSNADVRLRVWFNDGIHGEEQLMPDQRVAAVGYAMMAASVPAGSVTGTQLASNLTIRGTVSAGSFYGKGTFQWQIVNGTAQQAQPNVGYLAAGVAQVVTVTLPESPNAGDTVSVSGAGAGGWKIAQNAGQYVLPGRGTDYDLQGVEVVWTPRESSRQWCCVASSADGTKLVAGELNGRIYTSADSGVTWTPRESNRAWYCVASSADGTKLVAGAYGGKIFTSTDSGVTWTPHAFDAQWSCVASSADGTKLVAGPNSSFIYTSADSGVTWTACANYRNWNCVASSADGTKLVAGVYGGLLYTSTDSGDTWTPRESVRNWNCVASSADGTKLVAGVYDGFMYTSADSGATWIPRESVRVWGCVASSADGTKLVAGASGGFMYTSADSGVTWRGVANYQNWRCVASSTDGNKRVTGVEYGQIYTSIIATTPGTSGYITGSQGTSVELQYIGDNQFMPLRHEGTILYY